MNKTKKLTQGAMLLAILGALILIDRMTAYWFSEIVVLIAPIIIIIYSAMHCFKDSVLLSVGVIIISFLLGNFQMLYLIYIPVGIVTGLAYSYAMQKGLDKSTLLFIACVSYTVGEIIASYVIYPLLGFPVSQMIDEMKALFAQSGSITGVDYFSAFSAAGLKLDNALLIIYLITVIIMGAMEGLLIHVLSIFLLKRFKIKDLGRINLWDIKPNKILSYVSFLSMFTIFFRDKINNEILYYASVTLTVLGFVVLLYYGYLFVTLYGAIVLRRNAGMLFVLLTFIMPGLLVILAILGFLYGAGPLRTYLEGKVNSINHE